MAVVIAKKIYDPLTTRYPKATIPPSLKRTIPAAIETRVKGNQQLVHWTLKQTERKTNNQTARNIVQKDGEYNLE